MSVLARPVPDFPCEIIAEIVEFASWAELWPQESPVSWLKSISTLSRVWCAASQRMIFYSFMLGVSARSPPGEGKQQIRYLAFLETRPDLGRYIRVLDVFSPVIPGEEVARRLPAAIPNVDTVIIDVKGARLKSASLTTLISGLAAVKTLTLWNIHFPIPKDTAIRLYQPLRLSNFGIDATCAVAVPILEALADSPCAISLSLLELVFSDSDANAFLQCRDAIGKLPNIQTLNLMMVQDTPGYKAFPDLDVSFKLQDRLTVLRVRLFAASDLTVAVFRALLRDAVLLGLLDLELEITSKRHFVPHPRPAFVPFSKDSAEPNKGAILAPAVAARLENLQIAFEDNTVVEDSRSFLDLFKVEPCVLKIEGNGLLLRTGRP